MTPNEELYDAAMKAITALFSDTSVPQVTTKENLESLAGEIEIMLDTLPKGE